MLLIVHKQNLARYTLLNEVSRLERAKFCFFQKMLFIFPIAHNFFTQRKLFRQNAFPLTFEEENPDKAFLSPSS